MSRPTTVMARMVVAQHPDGQAALLVELTEWDSVSPAQDERLRGLTLSDGPSRHLAESLRRRLGVREGREGLEIESTSFVGRLDLGPLRIAVRPKLPALPLTRLLRYAYGLRNLTTIEETSAPAVRFGLHDLLIALLAAEIEELLHAGLARHYVPLSASLESPQGRILLDQVIRQGGVREARLPCRYFERRADWHLNQVLRAGLEAAANLAEDRDLRRHVHRLAAMFGDVSPLGRFGMEDITRAEQGLTRLTACCRPALTVIRLLHDALGVSFDPNGQPSRMPGFLFDMNLFFQRLLSRFLKKNLSAARIEDEQAIRGLFAYSPDANPRRRSAPAPRPDYALFEDRTLRGFLDAKYRDIWQTGLPAEWLYQLGIYALASPSEVSVLLYATMSEDACDERLEIRQPVAWSNRRPASIILRPVFLPYLAELIRPDGAIAAAMGHQWADQLVTVGIRKQPSGRAPNQRGQPALRIDGFRTL